MKKVLLASLVVLFCGTVILSCKKSSSSDNNGGCTNNGKFTFLKTGNKLVYEYSDLLSADTLLTFDIGAKSSAGSYLVNLTGGGYLVSSGGDKRYMKECNDWLLIGVTGEPTDSSKEFPATRALGQTWTMNGATFKVVASNVPVVTPAGTFNADKITYYQANAFNTDTIYFNNSIGYIKYDGFIDNYTLKSKNF